MKNTLLPLFILIATTFTACKKTEEATPQQNLIGKWTITSSELLGSVVPGDGSYLVFSGDGVSGSGSDHKASDNSTGTFTYTMNSDATSIVIADTMSAGGSYNGTWDILELTDDKFRITATTILGNLKVEMAKAD